MVGQQHATTDDWPARVHAETAEMQRLGYAVQLNYQEKEDTFIQIVDFQRYVWREASEEGHPPIHEPEHVRAYLTIRPGYPSDPPALTVVYWPFQLNPSGEAPEQPLPVKSFVIETWQATNRLSQIVEEVARTINHVPRGVHERLFEEPVASSLLAGSSEPLVTSAGVPGREAGGQSARAGALPLWSPWWLALPLLTILVATTGFAIFQRVDPCASNRALAREQRELDTMEGIGNAVALYQRLYDARRQGRGGFCASRSALEDMLREAYLAYGARLAEAERLAEAAIVYEAALERTPSTSVAKATETLIAKLWERTNTAQETSDSPGRAVEVLRTVAEDLESISRLKRDAINPVTGDSLNLSQYRTSLALGDLHYGEGALEAAEQAYAAASEALTDEVDRPEQPCQAELDEVNRPEQPRQAELDEVNRPEQPRQAELNYRLCWLERSKRLGTMEVETGSELIRDLETVIAETPQTIDPAGRAIADWLFTVYIKHSQLLLEATPPEAEQAFTQTRAALALDVADKQAARQLFEQARKQLVAGSEYTLTVSDNFRTVAALAEWLRARNLPLEQDERPINLLVIADDENMPLRLTTPQGELVEPQPAYHQAQPTQAIAALAPGTYHLAPGSAAEDDGLAESAYNYVELAITGSTAYRVQIIGN